MILDETKGRFIVNMNGKEYLNYRGYQDIKNRNFARNIVKGIYHFRFFISAVAVYCLGRLIIDTLFPKVYEPVNYGTFAVAGYIFPYLLLYVVIVIIAVSWLVHGFGFAIVRR